MAHIAGSYSVIPSCSCSDNSWVLKAYSLYPEQTERAAGPFEAVRRQRQGIMVNLPIVSAEMSTSAPILRASLEHA